MIQLNEATISVIDDYMRRHEPLCLGWESFGFSTAYIYVKGVIKPDLERTVIGLKAESQDLYKNFDKILAQKRRQERYRDWFDTKQMWRVWNMHSHYKRQIKVYNLRDETMMFFDGEGGKLIGIFIRQKYKTVQNAVDGTENFVCLWNEFERWFDERRERMKEELLSKEQNGEIAKSMNVTNRSHGGVANLLKVLTKTMKEQGADIRSIAKVQYAVCKQAGIYIPDEFITDVATALVIEEGEENNG